MNPMSRCAARFGAAVIAVWLAACGGGGSGPAPATDESTQTSPPPAAEVSFVATGASASGVSLAWQRPVAGARFTIERSHAGGDWVAVASVDALHGLYLDTGLASGTDYAYRLVETEGAHRTLAEHAARTTDEQPVVTAAGSALTAAVTQALGDSAAQLRSPDGATVLGIPAGAFPTPTTAQLQAVTNTAPAGRGAGLRVQIDDAPTAPLTLQLRYDAAQDAEADGQRIAVQRADGSWMSLPLNAIDRSTRTLTAELPPTLFAALRNAGAASAARPARARLAAPSTVAAQAVRSAAPGASSVEFTVVRYLAFRLQPPQARVPVTKTLHLVPYARVLGQVERCLPQGVDPGCTVDLVLQEREIPFTNTKPGFERRWSVAGIENGNPVVGTVQPSGPVGATFKAPVRVPNPSTVTVSLQSHHVASGSTVTLSSPIEITPDGWVGTLSAVNGPSDAGTTFTALADATWTVDEAASTETRTVYRASGNVDVVVSDDDCQISVTPSRQAVASNPLLAELVVDASASPARYTLRLIAFWSATLSATCPGGGGSSVTPAAGYGWDVSGTLSADGSRIEGSRIDESGARIDWSFTRPSAGTP